MLPPNPAVIEVILHRIDPITSAPFDDVTVRYGTGVELNAALPSGYEIAWSEREDIRGIRIGDPQDLGGGVIEAAAISTQPETVRLRPLDPYDAVDMAPDAGVPQPLDVVKAHVIRGVMLATQLDAVVAPDNTVVTLIIETGMGTYVRYGGSWLLMPENSSALEDMALVQVAPSAMAVWDQSDSAGKTVSIADLPTKDVGEVETIEMPEDTPELVGPEEVPVVAGANIPSVNQVDDLAVAVRYALTHPESRWYVVKRAAALGALDKVPQEWRGGVPVETLPEIPEEAYAEDAVALPFEEATVAAAIVADARLYVQQCVNGSEPHWFGPLMMRAREYKLLDHPAIVAAIDWKGWMHPRGKDGTFIEKLGMVNVFADPNETVHSQDAERRRGQITDLTPEGAHVTYVDEDGNVLPADPAGRFPEVIPVSEISGKVMMAPRAIAHLQRSVTETLQ